MFWAWWSAVLIIFNNHMFYWDKFTFMVHLFSLQESSVIFPISSNFKVMSESKKIKNNYIWKMTSMLENAFKCSEMRYHALTCFCNTKICIPSLWLRGRLYRGLLLSFAISAAILVFYPISNPTSDRNFSALKLKLSHR